MLNLSSEQLIDAEEETPDNSEEMREEFHAVLLSIVDELEVQNTSSRESQVKSLRFKQYFWRGIQNIYWNEEAEDWSTIQADTEHEGGDRDLYDDESYDRIINVYKAMGLSIIASLGSAVPRVKFFPQDADSINDITTARGYEVMNRYIDKHNKAELLILRALYVMYNQDQLFGYTYYLEDPKLGMNRKPIFEIQNANITDMSCPHCGETLGEQKVEFEQQPEEQTGIPGMEHCETCNRYVVPNQIQKQAKIPRKVGVEEYPKGRQVIEIYGPLHVKVPHFARDFSQCPYLILEDEHHESEMMDLYPKAKEDILKGGGNDRDYDAWGRSVLDNSVEQNDALVTRRQIWLRPYTYNLLYKADDDKFVVYLKEKYPNGIYLVSINDKIVDIRNEDIDAHWTVSSYPFSEHIHGEAIGDDMIPVQEMKNDVIDITIETVRRGIPINLIDKDLLNWEKFGSFMNEPGATIPTTANASGQTIQNRIHSFKPAMLSGEVLPFNAQLDKEGHFVMGVVPALYGGQQKGGSDTLGEYELSKTNSMQRLSVYWKVLNEFWAELKKKATIMFRSNLSADEQFVEKQGNNFINSYIRLAELQGEIGEVTTESSDTFPVTWPQISNRIMELFRLNNPQIMQSLLHSENLSLIGRALGIGDIYIPGENDRDKQLNEIYELLKSGVKEPEEVTEAINQEANIPIPTIIPDKILDDHGIHLFTIRAWANSIQGQDARLNNPEGYQNVMAHANLHILALQASAPPSNGEEPVKEEMNGN